MLRLANGLTLAGAFRESTLMSGIIRVLVPLDSQSDAAFQLAFKYAESICQKSGANVIVLLTHTKSQLEHTGLARMLGSHVIKAIGKGNATTSAGYALRAETMRTLRYLSQKSVLVVYYAEAGILDVADGVQNVAGVVAVPDHPGDADPWVQRWGAHVHGQTRQAPSVLIKDPVVVAALDELTKIINLSTGLAHPRDKERADETLRILRAKGHADPTPNIKSWAIQKGWKPDHAVALETLARKIWGLRNKPSLGRIPAAHKHYERWQK